TCRRKAPPAGHASTWAYSSRSSPSRSVGRRVHHGLRQGSAPDHSGRGVVEDPSLTVSAARGIIQCFGEAAHMADSVYNVIELIGTSTESWEQAGRVAGDRGAQSFRNLRVAEVVEQDLVVEDGKVQAFRSKLKLSFKNES